MYFLGSGIESAEAAGTPQAVGIIRQARRVWARDELSAEFLSAVADDPAKVVLGSDLAHIYLGSLDTAPHGNPRGPAGMVLNLERAGQLDASGLERYLSSRDPGSIRWIAQEVRDISVSEMRLWSGFGADTRSRLSLAVPDNHGGRLSSFLAAYDGLASLLSTRYHSALAGAWRGVPISVFARSWKLRGLIRQLGAPECAGLGSEQEIAEGVAAAAPVPRGNVVRLSRAANQACAEFFGGLEGNGA